MSDAAERRGVVLLLNEAGRFYREGRYADALRAAEKAREAAKRSGDIGLEVRAAYKEAAALALLGRPGEALTRCSWILSIAEEPAHRAAVAEDGVASAVVIAFLSWADCAMSLPPLQVDRLFDVLDAGERFVRAIGKPTWRAGLLRMRAKVLSVLGRGSEAIGFAEEGLTLALRDPTSPGSTLASHRSGLGHLLRDVGRFDEARALYQTVHDDAGSSAHARLVALQGLHACSLAANDGMAARRFADEAVRLAEPMGDDVLSRALRDLSDACLEQGDLGAARTASDRLIDVGRRLGTHEHLLSALSRAAEVALAERDPARAAPFLAEAQPHAEALDRARNRTVFRAALDKLREQLAVLEAGVP